MLISLYHIMYDELDFSANEEFDVVGFGHSRKQLNKIWEIIKDAYCPADYDSDLENKFIGLAPVPFDLEFYENFETNYYLNVRNHHNHENSKLRFKAVNVLNLIKGNEIEMHHRSCAGQLRNYQNNALCIHYLKDGEKQSVALPGVNYVPSEELISYWKRENQRETEVINSFILMNFDFRHKF